MMYVTNLVLHIVERGTYMTIFWPSISWFSSVSPESFAPFLQNVDKAGGFHETLQFFLLALSISWKNILQASILSENYPSFFTLGLDEYLHFNSVFWLYVLCKEPSKTYSWVHRDLRFIPHLRYWAMTCLSPSISLAYKQTFTHYLLGCVDCHCSSPPGISIQRDG